MRGVASRAATSSSRADGPRLGESPRRLDPLVGGVPEQLKEGIVERSTELESLVREVIDAMRTRDFVVVERMLSRTEGAVMIGSDASEYTRDIEEVLRFMRESAPDQSGYTVVVDEVHAYDEGQVGWFDGTIRFEREGESVKSRTTGVAHREHDQWRFVQMHLSVGVPNEHMFDPMFRTDTALT
jgi:SnoaL-like domain